jgi:hypothetical protein
MDGLFQILIIGLFIVASIFDAVTRGKKKQEQKDRMKAEEAREAGEGTTRPRPPRPAPGTAPPRPSGAGTTIRPPDRARGGEDAREPVGSGRAKAPTGAPKAEERRTAADELIPEDFWAILTGQAPARREPEPEAEGRALEPEPPVRPEVPVPVPSDRYSGPRGRMSTREKGKPAAKSVPVRTPEVSTPTVSDPDSLPTRRSSRWMEGLGKGKAAPRRPDPMDEPWGRFEDISKGEISDGEGSVQGAVDLDGHGDAQLRAGVSDSPHVRLLASGRKEDLRSAIVLREVLGTPVGARGREDESRGWRWED